MLGSSPLAVATDRPLDVVNSRAAVPPCQPGDRPGPGVRRTAVGLRRSVARGFRVKVRVSSVDTMKVESSKCVACGADLALSGARYCSECVASIPAGGVEAKPPRSPSTISDEYWRYITWGAIAAAIIAVGALAAVLLGSLKSDAVSGEVAAVMTIPPAVSSTVEVKALESIDVPVTGPIVIEAPRIGPSTRYHREGAVVVVRVTMDECERSEGMLRAGGTIRNDSPLGQSLSYTLTVDLERSRLGTRLARLEDVVDRVGPGETAAWSVETRSTKVVTVRCDVASLRVAPRSVP
jgi:hypothetical protein